MQNDYLIIWNYWGVWDLLCLAPSIVFHCFTSPPSGGCEATRSRSCPTSPCARCCSSSTWASTWSRTCQRSRLRTSASLLTCFWIGKVAVIFHYIFLSYILDRLGYSNIFNVLLKDIHSSFRIWCWWNIIRKEWSCESSSNLTSIVKIHPNLNNWQHINKLSIFDLISILDE